MTQNNMFVFTMQQNNQQIRSVDHVHDPLNAGRGLGTSLGTSNYNPRRHGCRGLGNSLLVQPNVNIYIYLI